MPTPVETWEETLPLTRILADALPKHDICDHSRVVNSLTQREIDVIAECFAVSLKDVLNQHIAKLKSTFVIMDRQVLKSGPYSAASKFVIETMEGGSISGYHSGPEFKLGICFSAISFEVYIQKNYTCELSICFVADRCQCMEVSLESQFFFVRLMVLQSHTTSRAAAAEREPLQSCKSLLTA